MVDLDYKIIEKALENHELGQDTINSILEEIKSQTDALDLIADINDKVELEENSEEKEKTPRKKKQFNIIVSDPEGKIPTGTELIGWVTQMDEDEPIESALHKIHTAVYDFNAQTGKSDKFTTVGDACQNLKSKFFKNAGIAIKTKEPVFVQITNNKIPVM